MAVKPSRPGFNSPYQKQGSVETYKTGLGWQTVTGTLGQVPTVQADGSVAFAALTVPTEYFTTVKRTTYTGDGTHTVDAKCLAAFVFGCGGGGGGGGAQADGIIPGIAAGGGGGGHTGRKWFTVAGLGGAGTNITVTMGTAGNGGSSTGGNGTAGGNTTFGALLTCVGGALGTGTGASAAAKAIVLGGRGGFGTTGDENDPGGDGENSWYDIAGTTATGGRGGNSSFGQGGAGGIDDAAGTAGSGRGAGGGGAAEDDTTGRAGGAGTAGTLVVLEFIKA